MIDALSQVHFTVDSNTGNNMTVLVKYAINPSINGKPLSSGDEIGAFSPDGICVGSVVWNRKNAAITVWGDDEQTPAADGIKIGEKIGFRIWDADENAEYRAVVEFASGSSTYSPDGIAILSHIKGREAIQAAAFNNNGSRSSVEAASGPLKEDPSVSANTAQKATHSDNTETGPSAPVGGKKSTKQVIVTDGDILINLITPADSAVMAGDSILFSWHRGAKRMQRYVVEIFSDSSCKKPAIDSVLSTSDTFLQVERFNKGVYWWRVRGKKGDALSGKSAVRRLVLSPFLLKSDPFSTSWEEDASEGAFAVSFELPGLSPVQFTVLDGSGKKVRRIREKLPAGSHTLPVSIETLGKGNYSYILETDFFTLRSAFSIE
ncbi:MAG: hypothetical protein JXA18_13225 [Chitinispirillaceae bacterium]|nr:hypothetical protein [Chitinispirillaceae bacterium]